MRITNNMLQRSALGHMQDNLRKIADSQEKVSTGLRLQKPSDDPTAASAAMRSRRSLRAVDQYQRGIEAATTRATSEETVLDELSGILGRAKVLASSQSGSTATAQTRSITKAEVDELLKHAVTLANTRVGDEYLFGGTDANTRPYDVLTTPGDVDFTTTSPAGVHQVEIAEGRFLTTTHNGVEVFEDTRVLSSLRDLSRALAGNDEAGIATAMADIDGALTGVNNLIGDVGARVHRLDLTRTNLEAMEANLLSFRSELEEVDIEAAVSELMSRQTTLQAAMLATSRVMGLTLADYLR